MTERMVSQKGAVQHPADKERRGEIDTSLPYESVKAAVSLFDARMKGGPDQKHGSCETGITNEILSEHAVVDQHKLIRAMVSTGQGSWIKEGLINSNNMNGIEHVGSFSSHVQDAHVSQDVNLAKQRVEALAAELQTAKKELQRLEQELLIAKTERDAAIRAADEAHLMAESNAKRVDELSREILGTNESLLLVKMACVEANKDRAALMLAAKKAEGGEPGSGLPAQQNPESSNLSVNALSEQLEAAQLKLRGAFEAEESYKSTIKHLQEELDHLKKELANMKDREVDMDTAFTLVKLELDKVKCELKKAEHKADEANKGMSLILQQKTKEAEAANSGAEETNAVNLEQAKLELEAIMREAEDAVLMSGHVLMGKKANSECCPTGDVVCAEESQLQSSEVVDEQPLNQDVSTSDGKDVLTSDGKDGGRALKLSDGMLHSSESSSVDGQLAAVEEEISSSIGGESMARVKKSRRKRILASVSSFLGMKKGLQSA